MYQEEKGVMVVQQDITYHSQRVMSVVLRKLASQDLNAHVTQSWTRCLYDHRLDPAECHSPSVVEYAELVSYQDEVSGLLADFVEEEMIQLYQRIAGTGYSVILANAKGVITHYIGDPNLTDYFAQAGLRLGAVWHESYEGTNGIGTCLHDQMPITIYRDEHFRGGHINLTCSGAPIFDAQGQLIAVLDVSTTRTHDSRNLHTHTAALVSLSAKLIENFCFQRQHQGHWILRLHRKADYVGQAGEGLIALDDAGRVVAVNHQALKFLNMVARDEVVGKSIAQLFTTTLTLLLDMASRQPGQVFTLHDSQRGMLFYGSLRFPRRTPAMGRHAVPALSVPTEVDMGSGLPPNDMSLQGLAGKDVRMLENVRIVQRVMNRGVPILLQGETGCGKEVFAKAIHQASDRAQKPFVALNCAAIPESLIESELFGYKHGAFTGARREGMKGKILQSSGGTLFLDEIGDMPLALQTRLLRVLEEKEVLPLGSEVPIPVELHLISATHRDLQILLDEDRFREDLYYRINGLTLKLPPLRARTDMDYLIHRMVVSENPQGKPVAITQEAFDALKAFEWLGNIRQLRNVIRTALALCNGHVLTLQDLPEMIRNLASKPDSLPFVQEANVTSALEHALPVGESVLADAERQVILKTLELHHWHITKTASSLKMSRNTLYRKMKKHGINIEL